MATPRFAILAIGLTIVALGVSRAVPTVSPAAQLVETPPRYFGVNGSIFLPQHPRNYVLDTESGALQDFELSGQSTFEFASCSPTRADRDDYLVIGRITMRSGDDRESKPGRWIRERLGRALRMRVHARE